MSLKKKILGILLALMTVAAATDYAVHRWVIYPNYAVLELTQAKKDLARCVAALDDEIEHPDAFANDWSVWDETCRLVANQTHVHHHIWSLGRQDLGQEERQALQSIDARTPIYTRVLAKTLRVYTVVPGIAGTSGLLVRADVSRQVTAKGLAVMKYAIVSDVLIATVLLIVSLALLERTVIRPLSSLTRRAVKIGAGEDPATVCSGERDDEIGVLGREFDRMAQRLQATHQGLQREVDEHRRSRAILDTYHHKLRRLSSELLLAEEGERRRIAIELHDRIGQSLTVSKMRLDALAASRPESRVASSIQEVTDLLETTIADTRMLTFELSPPILYEFGLGAALEWLCEKFSREHDLDITFRHDVEDLPLETHLRVMLFQATRELLFNIVKHARAARVSVRMAAQDRLLGIEIEDDGQGFRPARVNADGSKKMGFGLFSIRERLDDLGGALDIRSELGRGTCVSLRCPMSPLQPEATR
jgi:signal transduction histidine kinase